GNFPDRNMVLYADQWRDRSQPSWTRVSRRMARADERIRPGIGASDAGRGFEPDHALGSNLAPRRILDAASFGGRVAVYAICKYFRAQWRDGGICRFLPSGCPGVGHLPFSAPRSIDI